MTVLNKERACALRARTRVRSTRVRKTLRSTARHPGLRATTPSTRTRGRLEGIRRIRRCFSAVDIASPTFSVPDEVDANETYEYLLTVSADNAEDASVEVTVTVLNKEALALCVRGSRVRSTRVRKTFSFDCYGIRALLGDNPEFTRTRGRLEGIRRIRRS